GARLAPRVARPGPSCLSARWAGGRRGGGQAEVAIAVFHGTTSSARWRHARKSTRAVGHVNGVRESRRRRPSCARPAPPEEPGGRPTLHAPLLRATGPA